MTATRTDASRRSATPPDLIVLDLGLPDMEGVEVCRRIRERSAVPIIVSRRAAPRRDKVAALEPAPTTT